MKTKALKLLETYQISLTGRHVIAAVSGGSDSMALLHFLAFLQKEEAFTLTAAHVNHGIRGKEADRDEQLVRAYCQMLGVNLQTLWVNIPEMAKASGESEEICGRRVRYDFFNRIDPHALVATAHHLEDAAETFFLNLARGTGLLGLTGIPPVRGQVIRPLLTCTKAEILQYCEQNQIPFATDSTNLSDDYARNRIRHRVLPVLEEINPSFLSCFQRCLTHLQADEAFLQQQTQNAAAACRTAGGYSVDGLLAVPEALFSRVLVYALRALGGTAPEDKHVQRVASFLRQGGSDTMNGGAVIVSDGKRLFCKKQAVSQQMEPVVLYRLPERITVLEKTITFSLKKPENWEKISKEVFQYSINHDRIIYPVIIRTRRDGDRFHPAGRGVGKTLRQLFCEAKTPREQRDKVLLLCDGQGILLTEGFGIDERVKPAEDTGNTLYVTIRRTTNDT